MIVYSTTALIYAVTHCQIECSKLSSSQETVSAGITGLNLIPRFTALEELMNLRSAHPPRNIETVASFLEFFRPRTGLMQGLGGLCAIGRLLIPLHAQGDTLANVFSRPH